MRLVGWSINKLEKQPMKHLLLVSQMIVKVRIFAVTYNMFHLRNGKAGILALAMFTCWKLMIINMKISASCELKASL